MVTERQKLIDKGREIIGNSSGGIDQIPFIGGLIGKGLTYLVPGKAKDLESKNTDEVLVVLDKNNFFFADIFYFSIACVRL